MKLAKEHELRTVAFVAISCGEYGYPPENAVEVTPPSVMFLAFSDVS